MCSIKSLAGQEWEQMRSQHIKPRALPCHTFTPSYRLVRRQSMRDIHHSACSPEISLVGHWSIPQQQLVTWSRSDMSQTWSSFNFSVQEFVPVWTNLLLNQVCLTWSRFPAAIQISHYTAHPQQPALYSSSKWKVEQFVEKTLPDTDKEVRLWKEVPYKSPLCAHFTFRVWYLVT